MNNEFNKHTDAFLTEARVLVEEMNVALLKLEKSPENTKYFHNLFRAIHTFKSMAATLNFNQIAKLCHSMENVLEACKNKQIEFSNIVDELFHCFDFLKTSLDAINNGKDEPSSMDELLKIKLLLEQQIPNNRFITTENTELHIKKVQSIDVKVEKLDALLNLVEEMIVNKMKLELIRDSLNNPDLSASVETMGRVINDLQYNVMKVRMISIGFIFNQFPRMIRDLAKLQHKEVNLEVSGNNIELDRSIIDEISESLVHIVRNAIDHGLETKEERIKANKSPAGEIRLSASSTKESVIIEVQDNGKGLNLKEIQAIAESKGILKGSLDKQSILNAIFSGVSTRKEVTDVSGRGLGLNIVKQKIDSIGGSIQVKSIPDQGTTFIIEIPLTLAVLKVLFVKVSNNIYAIPLASIERLLSTHQNNLKAMMNNEAIILEGQNVPITRLRSLFNIKPSIEPERLPIVVVRKGDKLIGLLVDELLTTQEIVIKPLNRIVKENKYVSGSAIIGSGDIVLILDIGHIILSERRFETEV